MLKGDKWEGVRVCVIEGVSEGDTRRSAVGAFGAIEGGVRGQGGFRGVRG